MAPIPIAIVMPRFEPGGTERQMIELVRRLDRSRWSVHVACFDTRGAWANRVAETAASVAVFPVQSFRSSQLWEQAVAFGRWCRRQRIALVHTTDLPSNIFGIPAAAAAAVPVRIANRREINPDKSAAQLAAQRCAYALAHAVITNCHAGADRLRLERVPLRKIAVVRNGLDVDAFPARRVSHAPRKIVVVANLRRAKGHDLLIDAAAGVLKDFPDASFEFVGDGADRARLEAHAAARGLSNAVAFLGHRDDVVDRLAAADMFVLPSRSEACSNALLEAMAAGLPIVATAIGGNLEVIDDGCTGLLVPPNSEALAAAVRRLMADPQTSARLGQAARMAATKRYSFSRMADGFESIYWSELAKRGLARAVAPQLAAS